jgi:hypothetical protein
VDAETETLRKVVTGAEISLPLAEGLGAFKYSLTLTDFQSLSCTVGILLQRFVDESQGTNCRQLGLHQTGVDCRQSSITMHDFA